MHDIKLLDVTLRDGGYKTNFHFSEEVIEKVLTYLNQSGIEYIEVGYRNGAFKPIADIGPAGMCRRNYLRYCKKYITNANLTVILHPKNVNENDFKEMQQEGVNSLRIVFPMQDSILGFKSIELAKKYGFGFFVNITRASQYTQKQLEKIFNEIEKYQPKAIYLADSNGSLTPENVSNLFSYLRNKISVPLGFHAHDNLFLAQTNAIAAINNGVKFIDASLLGLGKGAGNLRTEGFVSFLLSKYAAHYDLCSLLDAAEFIKVQVGEAENDLAVKDIIMGVFDLSQDDASNLGSFSSVNDYFTKAKNYHRSIKINSEYEPA